MRLSPEEDALGQALYAQYKSGNGYELMERDDGHISPVGGEDTYFSSIRKWALCERQAIREVRGKVLDIGCAVGRHALYLQDRGLSACGWQGNAAFERPAFSP